MDITTIAAPLAVSLTIETGELFRVAKNANDFDYLISATAHFRLFQTWEERKANRIAIQADAYEMQEPKAGLIITCSLGRNLDAIARDIRARLLTAAREHLIKSRAYDLQRKKEKNAERLRENLIKQFCPYEYQRGKFRDDEKQRSDHVYAHTTYENRIHIETNLHIADALKVLKFITTEIK